MELSDYRRTYTEFIISTYQTRLIGVGAATILENFPLNLPDEARSQVGKTLEKLTEELLRPTTPNEFGVVGGPWAVEIHGAFSFPSAGLCLFVEGELKEINFKGLAHAQELSMLLAHLDAFLSDSHKAIGKRDLRTLKQGKSISRVDIIDAGDWQSLIDVIVEEAAYEFGWKGIRERVSFLEREYKLSLSIPPDDLEELEMAEQLRHVIIHNGGRVSREYLKKTKRSDVKVGEPLVVTSDYADKVGRIVQALGSDVFKAVAVKFFGADPNKLTRVLGR